MNLSLFYFTCFLFTLLSIANQTELTSNSCPTSRRLLFLNGFPFLGEKKSEAISSSSKSHSASNHPRADTHHGRTIYIQPQTSNELGQKVRSYSHLLKAKLFTKEERAKLKKLHSEKKQSSNSKAAKTKTEPQHAPKTRDLVAVDDQERDRCRALLHLNQENGLVPVKDLKKTKKQKSIVSKVKNATSQAKKKVAKKAKSLLVDSKKKAKQEKPAKAATKSPNSNEKKNKKKRSTDSEPPISSRADEIPVKRQSTSSSTSPPPSASPPPSSSSSNGKSKREKAPPAVEEHSELPDEVDSFDNDNEEKNNSVVGRAYHFVKNMFQLSDDILENNHTHDDEPILVTTTTTNEQQHRQSRKLLSIEEFNHQKSINLIPLNVFSSSGIHLSSRRLLSAKTSKRTTSSKEKKTNSDDNKPKVGWNYRYRISRYLADKKTRRSGYGSRALTNAKWKQNQKKTSSSADTKMSKRKLLAFKEITSNDNDVSNPEIIRSVLITETFVPKRQLLTASSSSSKKAKKVEKKVAPVKVDSDDSDDEHDLEKMSERRRMKSLEELTDPVEIVRSYDQGLFKPRVGWQFRYRVSRYVDYLRQNIREDQERLKLGLQAIKRKTPQELSGRRKRVLDKPFASEVEEAPVVDENKPHVGWRYRYRISKMNEAKERGDYVDDEEEKRKARLAQKQKGPGKGHGNDDECVEWEYDSLDPELRKIGEEGKRVGWAYRYRIRRKLDDLKQKQAETGIPFDWETLGGGGKREKKVTTTTEKSPTVTPEERNKEGSKNVGWKYRYRVSKMKEAQKYEAAESSKTARQKQDQLPPHERLDPVLAKLTPEQRSVGWQYRYRIRRKLDDLKDIAQDTDSGRRRKKRKDKEKIIKQVEESIEKILNIDDIDETPFMEYFRRTSSYVFFGLLPTARKSLCLLPSPVPLSFCKEKDENDVKAKPKKTVTATKAPETTQVPPTKKLQTKKEKSAKQFIHSRPRKLDTIDEKIDEPVKPPSKSPTPSVVDKSPKKPSRPRSRTSSRRSSNEQVKHFDEEELPVKKLVGVESKKKNKKRYQIIGQEVKIKQKHIPPVTSTFSTPVTTTAAPPTPVTTTAASTPTGTTTTRPRIVVTTSPPVVELPTTTTPPPSPPAHKPEVVSTTTTLPPPSRSILEMIEEDEATTLLSTKSTTTEELTEEINETNENLQTTTIATETSTLSSITDALGSATGSSESSSSDSESDSDDSDSASTDSDSHSSSEDYDPAPMQKMKQLYESTKESVHDVFDLKDEKDSS